MTGQFKKCWPSALLLARSYDTNLLWLKFGRSSLAGGSVRYVISSVLQGHAMTLAPLYTNPHRGRWANSQSHWESFCFIGVVKFQFCWAWPELNEIIRGFVQMAPNADRCEALATSASSSVWPPCGKGSVCWDWRKHKEPACTICPRYLLWTWILL